MFPDSYSELLPELQSGRVSCESVVNHFLSEIKDKLHLNAFIEVFDEDSINLAIELDKKRASGSELGRLHGMVVGVKDNICVKGYKTSAASAILKGFTSTYSATCVQRLQKEGAIIIGRLNCDEFAMGGSNETSFYGPTKNPNNPHHVPGGSSGGSAAAVAARLCHVALGTDTGGSVRQPAAYCGVIGLKPSYGRVSRYGLVAYASSFDQAGPLAHSIEDVDRVMQIISGVDSNDSTSVNVKWKSKNQTESTKRKVAVFSSFMNHDQLQPEIKEAVEKSLLKVSCDEFKVDHLDFPWINQIVPCYYVLTSAEASSNLSRFDGIHIGERVENPEDLQDLYKSSRSKYFGKEVQRRIMLGTFVLSAGYHEAFYKKALKIRNLVKTFIEEVFDEYDFIITPTTPKTAFKIGTHENDPVGMYLEDIYTVLANMCEIPAISIPAGNDLKGLPIGLQIMAAKFKDEDILAFSQTVINNIRLKTT